jgi:hypothetical protein
MMSVIAIFHQLSQQFVQNNRVVMQRTDPVLGQGQKAPLPVDCAAHTGRIHFRLDGTRTEQIRARGALIRAVRSSRSSEQFSSGLQLPRADPQATTQTLKLESVDQA